MNIYQKLTHSLDNTKDGFSGRKLTALWSIMVATAVTYQLPPDVRLHALYAWQILALLCLGIITAEQVLKFRGNDTTKDNNS